MKQQNCFSNKIKTQTYVIIVGDLNIAPHERCLVSSTIKKCC